MTWLEERGQLLGTLALGLLIIGGYLGLVWAPPDVNQGNVMRIMYVHVPTVSAAYLAYTLCLLGSALYLWKRDLSWDRFAVASAELGVVFTALTIVAGSIWAKPTWGVWWTWDPRLTTTAVLFVIYAGYLMLRALQPDTVMRARQSAVIGIIGFLDIPIVHMSVQWWRSLHQTTSFPIMGDPLLDDRMDLALMVNLVAFTALFLFLLGQRLRLARLEQEREQILWQEVQRV